MVVLGYLVLGSANMARRGFFGSLFTALIIAVVVFLCLYFFVPSFSEQFFGISWSMHRSGLTIGQNAEIKEMTAQVESLLAETGSLTKRELKELQDKLKSAAFRDQVSKALSAGKDAVSDLLADMK